jgi:hypothetical protein
LIEKFAEELMLNDSESAIYKIFEETERPDMVDASAQVDILREAES